MQEQHYSAVRRPYGRFAVALALVALLAAALMRGPSAGAQPGPYGGAGLPPGVLEMSIAGLTLNLNEFPVINTNQPVISGRVNQTSGSVTITVESTPQTFTAAVGPDGRFSAQVPQPLDPGQHKVYVNGQLIGQFTVVAATASPTPTTSVPGPPATGLGRRDGNGLGWAWIAIAVSVGLGAGAAATVVQRRRTGGK